MKCLICTTFQIHLPLRVDGIHWFDRRLRIWQNFRLPMNSGAVVINIVVLIIGVTKFTNSGSENIAAFSPLSSALQGFLNQRIHARVIDISVAAD